jgi:putative tricarboxylic transport membrane protein
MLIATVGVDEIYGVDRFTFGTDMLRDGIGYLPVMVGAYGLGEVLVRLEQRFAANTPMGSGGPIATRIPRVREAWRIRGTFARGSLVGIICGIVPGAGATIASFVSYGIEKAVSRRREQFGTGVVEGVAAPEGANNAETGGALVPLLTLGIPGSGTTAMLLAALVLWGFKPGPLFLSENPSLFWSLVASMYIGNVMLLVLNLPLVPLFAQVLRAPAYVLYPLIVGVSIVGVFSVSGSFFDVALFIAFGLLGYLMRKLDYPAAPLVLGLVLGGAIERALRQSLMMSGGSMTILFTRPIDAAMLLLAVVVLAVPLFARANAWRLKAMEEEG